MDSIVSMNPQIQKKREFFSLIYHNRSGLERGFVEEYSEDLLKGLAENYPQEKREELKGEIKKEMEEKLLTNLESILIRVEAREKNLKEVAEDREEQWGQKEKELDKLGKYLEENSGKMRLERGKHLDQLLHNHPDFRAKLDQLLEPRQKSKKEKEQSKGNALGQVKKKLMQLLEEIVEKKSEQVKTSQVSGEKSRYEWLDQLAYSSQQQQKEQVVISHASFTFSYLALLYLEQIYYKFYANKMDYTANFESEAQFQKLQQNTGYTFKTAEDVREFFESMTNICQQLSELYMESKNSLVLQEDRLVEVLLDFNHLNQVESNSRFSNLKMNPHNKQLLLVPGPDKRLDSKSDIDLNETDLLDNEILTDEYSTKYVKIEEENDLWEDTLQDIHQEQDINESPFNNRLFLKRNIYNENSRYMQEGVYLYLRELDKLQQKATLGDYDAIPSDLQVLEEVEIPEYFQWDLRQTGEQWLQDALRKVIRKVLEIRFQSEKNMSRRELLLLDQEIDKYFQKDKIQLLLKEELVQQMREIKTMQEVFTFYQKGGQFEELGQYKDKHVNEDKQFQQLAFNISQELRLASLQKTVHSLDLDDDHLDKEQNQIFNETDRINNQFQQEINTRQFGYEEQELSNNTYEQEQQNLLKSILGVKSSQVEDYFDKQKDQRVQYMDKKARGMFSKQIGAALERVSQQEQKARPQHQLQKQIEGFLQSVQQQQNKRVIL